MSWGIFTSTLLLYSKYFKKYRLVFFEISSMFEVKMKLLKINKRGVKVVVEQF